MADHTDADIREFFLKEFAKEHRPLANAIFDTFSQSEKETLANSFGFAVFRLGNAWEALKAAVRAAWSI